MQASVWAAARMLTLHTVTPPIWRLRQFLRQTKSAPGGVQGRAALRAGAKVLAVIETLCIRLTLSETFCCVKSISIKDFKKESV